MAQREGCYSAAAPRDNKGDANPNKDCVAHPALIPHEANVERVMWALKDRFPLHFIVFKRISRNSSMRTSRAAEILKGSLWHYTIILLPVSHPASSACAEHQLTELFILPQYS